MPMDTNYNRLRTKIKVNKSGLKYNLFEISEAFYFIVNEKRIYVMSGFITDLASIPQFLWWLFPPHCNAFVASIIHDYISQLKLFDRKECDKIFLNLLLQSGMSKFQAYIMYAFVSIFSVKYYGKIKFTKK